MAAANYGTVPVQICQDIDSAWDPFNENQGSGTIYNTLFALSNMYIFSAGASVNPLEDVTVAATWSGLWAASSIRYLIILCHSFQPDGSTSIAPVTSNKKGLGNEYDANISYAYTEDVTFGVSLGWYLAGDAFNKINRDVASQALANVGVKF